MDGGMEKGSSPSVVCSLKRTRSLLIRCPSYQEFQPVSDNHNLNLYVFRHLPAGWRCGGD
jgi:hypothetical protein